MAASKPKYPLGSPQEHIEMCKTHDLPIDVICEDCDKFICATCAKTDHRDHDWSTLPTAATQKRRGLLKFLKKIKEEDLPWMEEKVGKMSKQITENEELCETEIKKLQTQVEEIMAKLSAIKKQNERILKENLKGKNEKLDDVKSELNKKKKEIEEMVKFMEENKSSMSDYGLIDNHRELTQLLSGLDVAIDIKNCEYSMRYSEGEINDDVIKKLIGKTLELKDFILTETSIFKYGDQGITLLRGCCENRCYIKQYKSPYTVQVNKEGEKKRDLNNKITDLCVTDIGDVYFTNYINNSVSCLSPSGSVSKVISTNPLEPGGICQSVDGGLLVTLKDMESDHYKLQSHSRRLLRHITVTGDVIHEYEYREDGQTRLFTWPYRVAQNSNGDICVVNRTSVTTGELVIMSPSGHWRSVYRGQNLTQNFNPFDVACDSQCNILVTDRVFKNIHLLSPDGEYLKFLLSEKEENCPARLSLYKSTLWVGYYDGLVKVFQYQSIKV